MVKLDFSEKVEMVFVISGQNEFDHKFLDLRGCVDMKLFYRSQKVMTVHVLERRFVLVFKCQLVL